MSPSSSGRSTIADQEAADAAYDRVLALIQARQLTGYSDGFVKLRERQAHIYWVGPVPQVLRQLRAGPHMGTVVFHRAPYTHQQMTAAIDRVVAPWQGTGDRSPYVIGAAGYCVDGTGIKVEIADTRNGGTPPTRWPPALSEQVKELAGDIPVLVVGGYLAHAV